MQSQTPVVHQINNGQDLELCLTNLMVPNSDIIKQAEGVIKGFLKHKECLAGFVQQIQHSQNAGVRQLSAVLMRLKLKKHWKKIEGTTREEIKLALLNSLLQEPTHIVRTSIIQTVGVLATYEISTWPDLSKFLMQCVQHEQASFRETGLSLFQVLIEYVGEEMLGNFNQLIGVLQKGLADQDVSVRIASLKALRHLVLEVGGDEQIEAVIQLIPAIVEALKKCIAENRNEEAVNSFEIFDELVEHKSETFDSIIPHLINFMFELALNTNLTTELREKATIFVEWCISYKPKLIIKLGVSKHIIECALKIMSENREEELEDDYEEDEDENTPYGIGSSLLDATAVDLPSKYVFQDIVERAVVLVQSQNQFERRAGITALGLIAEGCQEAVKGNLEQVIKFIGTGFNDNSRIVRGCAILAISSLAEYCQPEILDFGGDLLPFIIHCLDDKLFEIREKSAYTLDIFTQHMDPATLNNYLQPIMTKIMSLLTNGDRKTQEVSIATLSAMASASGKFFVPYFETVITLMKQIMEAEGQDILQLKARATECVGIVAFAVGKEIFGPYVDGFMRLAMANIEKNSVSEYKEYTFMFFESVAMTLGADFKVYVEPITNYVLSQLSQENLLEIEDSGTGIEAMGSALADDDIEEDDDDEGGFDGNNMKLSVRTSVIDEKTSAISAIGQFAKATGPAFSPFLHQALDAIIDSADNFHYALRRQSATSIRNMLYATIPTAEELKDSVINVSEEQGKIIDKIMDTLVTILKDDEDKETVARACESIIEIANRFGLIPLEAHVEDIMSAVITLLQQKAPCNQTEMDEEGDHDIVLMDSVSDTVDTIAKLLGKDFAPHFAKVFPELIKYAQPNRPIGDRIMALGTICESLNSLQENMAPYVKHVLPLVLKSVQDSHYNAQRNALYGCGVISFFCKDEVQPHVMQLLQAIYPIFADIPKYNKAVVDNACGAIARFIACKLEMPLSQVVPVWCNALPLREDFEEGPICYTSLILLLLSENNDIAQHIPLIIQKLANGLTLPNEQMKPEVRQSIADSLKQFASKYPQQFSQIASTLSQQEQEALQKL
ncbi:hypothetical protein ABK040_013749 [Willaertia magna]